jgi:2-keto-3-deoxy-L-rhamnonate aldolase RhmA
MASETGLKARMQAGTPAIGAWLTLPSPSVAEIVAGAGYDLVMIDLEHGPAGPADAVALLQAVAGRGPAGFLRVPDNDPVWLKRALDTGIEGVMVPGVASAAEAERAVAGCRYPPRGHRGFAVGMVRASGYGRNVQGYLQEAEARLTVICQIESPQAVDRVEAIAAVEGVDMLFVGPHDLSAQMGFPGQPDHPEVRAAVDRVARAVKTEGKLLGGIATPERPDAELLAAGCDLILSDSDVALLRDAADARVAAARRLAGRGPDAEDREA